MILLTSLGRRVRLLTILSCMIAPVFAEDVAAPPTPSDPQAETPPAESPATETPVADDGSAPEGASVPPLPEHLQTALKEYPVPTVEEAKTFADALGEVIYIPNPQAWQGIIDWEAFLNLCFADVQVQEKSRKDFEQGFLRGLNTRQGLFGQIFTSLGESGSYELVRVHEVDGRPRALFRLVNQDGGLNYHDFILIRDAEGRPRAIDLYIYLSGENFSTTIRRVVQQLAAEENRTFFDRLAGKQQVFLENMTNLQRMTQLVQQGQGDEALDVYESLPAELKSDKLFLVQRYLAATTIDDEQKSSREIEATVELFRQAYPQDACLDFMAIDYHFAREEYDETIAVIDRLDKTIGGDPYLHELRGGIYYQAGQAEKAVEQFELAIAGLPQRPSAYFSLIGVALEKNDFDATLSGLKRLDQAVMMEWNDFTEVPAYSEFVASPQHAEWLEYLESK